MDTPKPGDFPIGSVESRAAMRLQLVNQRLLDRLNRSGARWCLLHWCIPDLYAATIFSSTTYTLASPLVRAFGGEVVTNIGLS